MTDCSLEAVWSVLLKCWNMEIPVPLNELFAVVALVW